MDTNPAAASALVRTNERRTLDMLRDLLSERAGGASVTLTATVDFAFRYALRQMSARGEAQRQRDEKALAAEKRAATVREVVRDLHARGLLKTGATL